MKHKLRCTTILIALLVLVLSVPGSPAVAAPAKKSKKVAAKVDSSKKLKKHDPFRSFLALELQAKKIRERKKNKVSIFPLQRLGIEKFKLVGIVSDSSRRLAIVETGGAKGRYYPLEQGTVIGLNKGRVIAIDTDQIIVEEVKPGRGAQRVRRITIKLHRAEEEGA